MENLLHEIHKFDKTNLKNDRILRFADNQKSGLKIFLKNIFISEETMRSLKQVGVRPGIIFRRCKTHKDIVNKGH